MPHATGPRLRAGQAAVLGLLHGPAELLPISSSGHVALVPWLANWEYRELAPEIRKTFEVALHAGTAAALLVTLRDEVTESLRDATPRLALLIGLAFLPPAAMGYVLEGAIERGLGHPAQIAGGLAVGGLALAWADRSPQVRNGTEAGVADAIWLGVAQACALAPGVSRNGATLTAARLRRFTRAEASRLSRHVALPIIAAASARRLGALRRTGLPREAWLPFALGTLASFGSTIASASVIRQVERDRPLLPYALYRVVLAGAVLQKLLKSAR